MLDIECAHCQSVFHADEEHIGKRIRCSGCGYEIPISGHRLGPDPAIRVHHAHDRVIRPRSNNAKRNSTYGIIHRKLLLSSSAFLVTITLCCASYFAGHRGEHAEATAKSDGNALSSVSPSAQIDTSDTPSKTLNSTPAVANRSRDLLDDVADELKKEQPDACKKHRGKPHHTPRPNIPELDPDEAELVDGPDRHFRSLPTGTTLISDAAADGHGKFVAINHGRSDALVVVVSGTKHIPVREVYVKSGDRAHIDRLSPGTYKVYFVCGLDWDSENEKFTYKFAHYELEGGLSYEESEDSEFLHYGMITVTLNPLTGGNVKVLHVSPAEFRAATGISL